MTIKPYLFRHSKFHYGVVTHPTPTPSNMSIISTPIYYIYRLEASTPTSRPQAVEEKEIVQTTSTGKDS